MPSVLTPEVADLLTFRVLHELSADSNVKWYTTYEVEAIDLVGTSNVEQLAAAIVAAESLISLNTVRFRRVTVSTWVPDSHPYNPLGFVNYSYNENGSRAPVGEPLPLVVPLALERGVESGRQGKLMLRGVLVEADVQGPGGSFIFATGAISGYVDLVDDFNLVLADYIQFGTSALRFSLISRIGLVTWSRAVTRFGLIGPRLVKLNHKYFDVPPP